MTEVTFPRKVSTWRAAAQLCVKGKYNSRGSYWNVSYGFNYENSQNDTKGFKLWYSFLVGSVRNAN